MIEHHLTKYRTDEGRFAMSWLQEGDEVFAVREIKIDDKKAPVKK